MYQKILCIRIYFEYILCIKYILTSPQTQGGKRETNLSLDTRTESALIGHVGSAWMRERRRVARGCVGM